MTQVVRTVNAGTLTAVGLQHTQPYHICELVLPTSGTQYLSEGPQLSFDSGGGSHDYLEGRIKVGNPQWNSDGEQSCTLEILDDANHNAATWFLNNRISNASVTLWVVYRNANGTSNTPVKYLTGSCDTSELSREGLKVTVISMNSVRKFFPNTYLGSAGAAHMPQEGAVVFWNSSTYVLEVDYG